VLLLYRLYGLAFRFRKGLLLLHRLQHLHALAAVPVDGYALASKLVRQHVCLLYVLRRGPAREVYRLGHCVVNVFLERGLHPHVPLRRYVVCSDEQPPYLRRYLLYVLYRNPACKLLHQLVRVEVVLYGHCLELVVYLYEVGAQAFVHVPHVNYREDGLYALRCAACYYAYGACWSYGGDRRIPQRLVAKFVPYAVLKSWERPALLCELLAHLPGVFCYEGHGLFCQHQCLVAVVPYAQLYEHVCPAHDAEAYAPYLLSDILYLLERIRVGLYDVVKEPYAKPCYPLQLIPVYVVLAILLLEHLCHVY
jgi:hypothetical protein